MKQVFYPYTEWEDYKNGMFCQGKKDYAEQLIEQSKDLLSNSLEFERLARDMILNWKKSAAHNLTNKKINRRAWIGQATCCYKIGTPEILTRESWSRMSLMDKLKANRIADKLIKQYEAKNRELYKELGEERLF